MKAKRIKEKSIRLTRIGNIWKNQLFYIKRTFSLYFFRFVVFLLASSARVKKRIMKNSPQLAMGKSGKLLFFVTVLFTFIYLINADFENSWTMYMEQPCCSGSGNHHVRHHRGRERSFSYLLAFENYFIFV